MDNIDVKKKDRTLFVGLAIVIVILLVLCITGIFLINPPEETVQGQVEATHVRVSGKLPGRVAIFYVEEGQQVKRGDTLAKIARKQGTTVSQLCRLNHLTRRSILRPGQVLRCS